MTNETWTIKRCLDWTSGYLGQRGDERPRLSAEWLLSSITGLSRTEIYMRYDEPLSADELARMHEAVVRRAKGEPLQYIAGKTTFRTIDVACEPGVLIPRPETEVLVEEVLTYLDREVLGASGGRGGRRRVELPWNDEVETARKAEDEAEGRAGVAGEDGAPAAGVFEQEVPGPGEGPGEEVPVPEGFSMVADTGDAGGGRTVFGAATDESFVPLDDGAAVEGADAPGIDADAPEAEAGRTARVLEVGCGTGCISLSIATERAGRVTCIATDIAPEAVALSERNRSSLGIPPETVQFREGNLVAPLDRETEWGTFDVLVSNPPYVPSGLMDTLPREVVAFEPALALDGGADGLDYFRRLLNAAPYMLRSGGLLACELFEDSLDEAHALCERAGMADVRVVNDLAGRPRVITARTVRSETF